MTMRSLIILGATCAVVFAPGAQARTRTTITPYIEVDQTVFADLKNGDEVFTYTTLSAGIDATVSTERVDLGVAYQYQHRFGWGNLSDDDVHSGIVRGRVVAVPNLLSLEAGALATRTRTDIRSSAANPYLGNPRNIAQLYSAYVGPTLATRIGDFDVGAAYRFGYTKVDVKTRGVAAAGQPELGVFDDSTSHIAEAYVGMAPGPLPFGWRVSGSYERKDAGQLDQRFEGKSVRGDVTVPVTPTLALVGGAGYEDIKSSYRDALRDANGVALTDANGRFRTDPASPRLLAFDSEGFIWDAGVLYKPSRRTSIEARVGQRYGGTIYTLAGSYQPSEDFAFDVSAYDGIQTFGRQINAALAALPTNFSVARNPFGGQLTGCVYGATAGGAGNCLNGVLQSLANGTYRARGVNGVVRYGRGPWSAGAGVGYAQRRFFAPSGVLSAANGVVDESVYAQAFVARKLDEQSVLSGDVYINWYNSGLNGAPDVLGTGATGTYSRTFGRRLTGSASLGLYSTRVEDQESSLIGAAQIGARYSF
jgi:hypothetical protein